ncbi:MAG: hypothetical protein HY237_14990 [Acidobacteria bacterium]|nr:hypothetical protein [Acidobacteriota bacterium]
MAPPKTTAQETDYARGFKDGLAEHRAMLEQIRKEFESSLAQHHAMLDEMRKEFESNRTGNTALTVFYGVSLFFVFGAGVFSLGYWHRVHEAVRSAEKEVRSAEQQVSQLTAVHTATLSEVHSYLKQFSVKEGALVPDSASLLEQASIDEVDHLTFFANPLFRFREPETTEDVDLYTQVLLTITRWHLVRGRFGDALKRLELFFPLHGVPKSQEDARLMARAHSYKAYAYMELLRLEQNVPVILTDEREERMRQYRSRFEENIKRAKVFDATWSYSYIWDGLYQSLCPEIPEDADQVRSLAP